MRGLRRSLPLALLLVTACASERARPVDPAAAAAASDLTTRADRARLEMVADARAHAPAEVGYRIGPEDLLQIRIPDLTDATTVGPLAPSGLGAGSLPTVTSQPAFLGGVRVGADGMITLPTVGAVHAEGQTAQELETVIATRLRDGGILRNPQVSVVIAEYRSRVVAVVGSVERPGLYPLTRPGATLADLIWAAGGPSKDAGRVVEFAPTTGANDGRHAAAPAPPAGRIAPVAAVVPAGPGLAVRAVRAEPAGRGERLVLALSEPAAMASFALADPPRIVVDLRGVPAAGSAARFDVRGTVVAAVRTAPHDGGLRAVIDLIGGPIPHTVRVDGDAVVADLGETDAATLRPAAAQIPVPTADPTSGVPVRLDLAALLHAQGSPAQIENPEVRPGDVISIAPAGSVQVDGWVARPGSYPVTRGLTLSGAVAAAGGGLFPADREHAMLKRVVGPGEERTYDVDLSAVAGGRMPDVPVTDGDVVRLPTSVPRMIPYSIWFLVNTVFRIGASVVLF